MATGNGGSVLRPGVGIARAILPGSRRLMAILAQRVGTLCSAVSATIQERPRLLLGLLTALVGGVCTPGWPPACPAAGRCGFGSATAAGSSGGTGPAALGEQVLANPIVQGYLRRTVLRAVSRKLGR